MTTLPPTAPHIPERASNPKRLQIKKLCVLWPPKRMCKGTRRARWLLGLLIVISPCPPQIHKNKIVVPHHLPAPSCHENDTALVVCRCLRDRLWRPVLGQPQTSRRACTTA